MSTPTQYINDPVYQRSGVTSQLWSGALLIDWENYVFLNARTSSGTTAYISNFRKIGDSNDYVVPAGKVLKIKVLHFTFGGGNTFDTTSATFIMGYNDAAIGLDTDNTSVVNFIPVDIGGKPGAGAPAITDVALSLASRAQIPEGKYPTITNFPTIPTHNGFPINTLLVGIEEDL